mmetsp:Transcript_35427/g.26386  ORF Transcript_35427/g.26386 Transcript_35427/m.26386 type:complete len:124 (-) Transcript_35427:7-378(-)
MHIPYLMDCASSSKDSIEFVNLALQTLANLCKKEQMRPYVMYNEGMKLFVEKLRDTENMMGRRIAAEALHYVSEKDEFLKAKIANEMKDELARSWRYEIDPVLGWHMKDFLKHSGDKQHFVYS